MFRFRFLVSLSFSAAISFGQVAPTSPAFYGGTAALSAEAAAPPVALALPEPVTYSLPSLSVSEEQEDSAAPVIGVHRTIDPGALPVESAWQSAADGRRFWRVAIHSPGAVAMRVRFQHFDAGEGRLRVYAGDDSRSAAQAYSGRGPLGDGDFWSPTVQGDVVVVEYEPAVDAADDAAPFAIRAISHVWSDTATQGLAPRKTASSRIAQAAPCHIDVSCYPAWADSSRTVAKITYEEDGKSYLCSGALVITRSRNFTPYFLTANHCVDNDAVARTVEAIWFNQTSTCNGAPPVESLLPRSVGARFVAGGGWTQGDFTLLRLSETPANVWFSGWNPNEVAMGAALVGIHHPDGSYKRIPAGVRVADESAVISGSFAPASRYYQVRWAEGRTQPGSSGSPLFSDHGVLAGVLSYGPVPREGGTHCDVNPFDAGYGRFSVIYPQLAPYLEDGSISVSPSTLEFTVNDGTVSPPSRTITITTSATNPITFTAAADVPWIQLTETSGSVSPLTSRSIGVAVNPSALAGVGVFNGKVTVQSSDGGLQTVTVRATATARLSSVRLTVSPNPVPKQAPDADGYTWFYTLKVEERGGAPTRLTSLRFSGSDVTQNIVSWFGTDLLPASGSLSASLRARGYAAPSSHLFELRGTDVNSGRAWAASTTLHLAAGAPGPAISSGGVVNAASFQATLAPGAIFSIFGTNLATSTAQAAGLPLPTTLGGATVSINGVACPLFYASPLQINAQVPTTATPGTATVTVRAVNQESSASVQIAASAPGLFTLDGVRGIVVNEDGSLNSQQNPARRGSVVVTYATGQGAVTPPVTSGAPASAAPLSWASLRVEATVGGAPATVHFAGLAPGLVGLMQLNLQVPANAALGETSLSVLVGGRTSNTARIWLRN